MAGKDWEELREKVGELLLNYYNQNIYSAACGAVSRFGKNGFSDCLCVVGRSGEGDGPKVDESSIFDLASLTKPFVTLTTTLHLVETGIIGWEEPLSSLLEGTIPDHLRLLGPHHLLCHNSGLPAHREYWQEMLRIPKEGSKKWLLDKILATAPEYPAGSRHLYSDLGYMLLGLIIEKRTGQLLDHYWLKRVAGPAGLEGEFFFAPGLEPQKRYRCVSTGQCRWSGRPLVGLVHDDNSRALGGVAGHAGLFGTARGVLALCKEFLHLYHSRPGRLPLRPETFRRACRKVGNSEWSCGFALPSPAGSSSGRFFSGTSIGHLGYTGVSFWIDPDRQVLVTLLTNRVAMGGDQEGIRAIRPELHDLVVECLNKEDPPGPYDPGGSRLS